MLDWNVPTGLNIAINVLLGLWIGLHLFGFLLGTLKEDRTARMYPFAKMAGSATLILIAGLFWLGAAVGMPLSIFSLLVMLGMIFGFLGDLTLAGFLPLRQELVFGMLWFGIGHALYIAAFLTLSAVFGLGDSFVQIGSALVLMAGGAILWRALISSPEMPTVLNAGALIYGLLLAAMTGVAVSVAIQQSAFVGLAAGAALFLASDTLLGNVIFRKNAFYLSRDLVWLLYIVGQLLIVLSNATALGLL